MILWGILISGSLFAAPPTAELTAAWTRFNAEPTALARKLRHRPSTQEWQEIAAGEVVKWRLPATKGVTDVLVAMAFIDQPLESVWVGILDDRHASLVSDFSERILASTTRRTKILYQRAHLPFPFTDRHWVLAIENNARLFKACDGAVWERTWRLDPRGEGALVELPEDLRVDLDGIIWPPVANGGWVLVKVGWGTLLTYHAQTHIGGYIPKELVTRYAMSKLDEMLAEIDRLATRVPRHYVTGHVKYRRPDGSSVPTFGK